MLRWILVASIVVLLSITVFMFIERFGDAPEPLVATASTPEPVSTTDPGTAARAIAAVEPEAGTPDLARARATPPEAASTPAPSAIPAAAGIFAAEAAEGTPRPSRRLTPAPANGFSLEVPVDCTLGRDCFIQQYVDIDPGPEALDFTCGPLTYQKHKGTDFRIRNLQALRDGVSVLAARDGRVRAIRDGMDDVNVRKLAPGAVKGKECGNAVVIVHDDGWETQYCHMRKGSVIATRGQAIRAGDPIGMVGMSGSAEFPHLHLSVRKDGRVVDPFRGLEPVAACGADYQTLWSEDAAARLAYQPGAILDAGFLDRQLSFEEAIQGQASPESIRNDGQGLVIWYIIFGIRQGDEVSVSITGPDGNRVFNQTLPPHAKDQAQRFAYAGRRTPPDGFAPGIYRGQVSIVRDGVLYDRRDLSVTLR